MKLTEDEQNMLDGKEGLPKRKAMELLVKYGDALGAERFVDTNNVHTLLGYFLYSDSIKTEDPDDIISEFLLDSRERVVVDHLKAFTTNQLFSFDMRYWKQTGISQRLHDLITVIEPYCRKIGVTLTSTCAPYITGNIPMMGEHCAWAESSAIAFCNAVLGARTNVEGLETTFASAITGKTPLWGFHLDEPRLGTMIINNEFDIDSVQDWDLMGYYTGFLTEREIPIYTNIKKPPIMRALMACGASGASSGGIAMYHVVGSTPEAKTLEQALGNRKPKREVKFGEEERRQAYERLNSAHSDNIDYVFLGCPHYPLEAIYEVCRLLSGKRVNENVTLFVMTARAVKATADISGFSDIIEKAGGHLLVDSCPLNFNLDPTKSMANDSAKMTHYVTNMKGWENVHYGTMQDCLSAAISGKWEGELR